MFTSDIVQFLELHVVPTRVDLELKVTFASRASILGAANDREGIGVDDLLIEIDIGTEDLQVRNASLSDDSSLVELGHNFAFVASGHPTDEVLALEGAACASILSHRDKSRTRRRDGQPELGHASETAREASRTGSLPCPLDLLAEPASLLGQFTAQVNVLVVGQEVSVRHPEHTIDLLVRGVFEGSLRLDSPAVRVVGPVTVPLTRVVSLTVRVSELHELLALIVSDVEDSIGVTLDNSFFVDVCVLTLGATGTHERLVSIEFAHLLSKALNIVLERFQSNLFWETILNQVGEGQMNLSCLDGRVRAVKLSVSLLKNGGPNLETIVTAFSESRLTIAADG